MNYFYRTENDKKSLERQSAEMEARFQEEKKRIGLELSAIQSQLQNIKTSNHETQLNGSLNQLEELYESFRKQAAAIDASLEGHVKALKLKTVQRLHELEKKMLKAEKKKIC